MPPAYTVYIGIGSNDAPQANIGEGLNRLKEHVRLIALSAVYQSPAVGDVPAAPYWNMVACIQTEASPTDLKAILVQIEEAVGRVRTLPNGKKSPIVALDFDILWVEGTDYPPHADILTRAYVAVPLAELAPHLRHPITDQSLQQVAQSFSYLSLERLSITYFTCL